MVFRQRPFGTAAEREARHNRYAVNDSRLQTEYPRFDGLDDGSLAVMVCRILSEDYPTPTPTEALQRKVAAPVGAYLQIVRRQELQAEADRLANLGQLTPVFWSDDADTPDDSDFLPDWMCHP